MVSHDKNSLEEMITTLRYQTKSYLDEIKRALDEREAQEKINIVSYFTYTLNISHNPEQESLCIGSYHIRNIGSQAITNPYVCIKVSKESPFSFSGKYVYSNFKQSLKAADGWERINDKTSKEEFWLKPLGIASIEPNEVISFSNFQITWSPKDSYAGSITAVTYSDQLKEGVAVINPINLNGTVHIEEGLNE